MTPEVHVWKPLGVAVLNSSMITDQSLSCEGVVHAVNAKGLNEQVELIQLFAIFKKMTCPVWVLLNPLL